MEKSNKSQKPSPQKPTISIGELSVKINPIINTTKVNIIANKNASGKYFCTILSKKRVTAFNMISPHHFQYRSEERRVGQEVISKMVREMLNDVGNGVR